MGLGSNQYLRIFSPEYTPSIRPIHKSVSERIDPGRMLAPRVKFLGYVRLNGTSARSLEAVAKRDKSPNTSNELALLLVFHEIGPSGWSCTNVYGLIRLVLELLRDTRKSLVVLFSRTRY